jgi:uncharacterized membrane protein YedE/YeeE
VIETLLDRFGDGTVLLMAGLVTGLLFGVAAQRSQFCLRASTVELARGQIGPRMSIWLIVFATALASTQALIMMDVLQVSDARQLSGAGSMSGAIIGGLMFGMGMVLARGCASRLLVLSATGNLRALVTGLLLTLVAQSALSGVLAPAREAISGLWLVSGPSRDLMQGLGLSRSVVHVRGHHRADRVARYGLSAGRAAIGGAGGCGRRAGRDAGLVPDLRDFAGVVRDRAGLHRDLHGPCDGHADGAGDGTLGAAVLRDRPGAGGLSSAQGSPRFSRENGRSSASDRTRRWSDISSAPS